MEIAVIFIIIAVLFITSILKGNPKRIEKMYTKEGYPKADILVLSFDGVPQGLNITMSCTPDNLTFEGNGVSKKILHEDIIDITLQTVDNKASASGFSYGKAIAGTMAIGTIGAIAGISGKKKQGLEMLVISYIEDDEIEYLTFLQETKKEYPINTEAFFLKEAIKRIKEVREGTYTPFSVQHLAK